LKTRTAALLIAIAIAAIVAVANLTGVFSIRNGTSEQALLTLGIIILITGIIAMLLAANIIAQSLKKAPHIAQNSPATESCFLANTSHEMRTPLNAIIGLSELMLHKKLPPEVADSLEKIHSSGMTLLGIINDLLDISKIEAGKFELIPVEYDVPSMINDIRSLNVLRIADKPITFQISLDETLPSKLIGDELRVKQIFNNLLSNACHYTEKGTIEWSISWEQDVDKIWLTSSIKDTGIGIHKEDIGKLFNGYNQKLRDKHEAHGMGLSLFIARRMAEAMNGSIIVSSVHDKGSTFTVRIQQKYASSPPIGPAVAETLKERHGKSYAKNKRMNAMTFSRIAMPYARVLIVDDVQANLDVAKGILKPYKMQVDCVTSGIEAIERIRNPTVKYHAIFMDYMMPKMDGMETARIIREEIDSDYARNIPIIALTANAIIGNEKMFLEKGFQAFLSKPIDIMRLDFILRQWVRDKKQEQENDSPADSISMHDIEAQQDPDQIDAEEIPKIEGIDWQAGLNYFGGNRNTYLSIIRSYIDSTERLIAQIGTVTEETLTDYAILVHSIKGSSYGIKASEAGKLAEELEHAAKAGHFQFILQNNPLFIESIKKLLSTLSNQLETYATNTNTKPNRQAPDETLLDQMQAAAANFKIDELEEVMASLECFTYTTQAELLIWLREKVNQMEFTAIHERLSQRKQETSEDTK